MQADVLCANCDLQGLCKKLALESMHARLLQTCRCQAPLDRNTAPRAPDTNEDTLVAGREATRLREVGGESRALGTGESHATQTP